MSFDIRPFSLEHIDIIVTSFADANWPKPRSTFEKYFKEQKESIRMIWLAYDNEQFAGYVTLSWKSHYPFFIENNIPEIMDLNVLPQFRNQGIGAALLKVAEDAAFQKSSVVGLGVGLYPDYGAAQKLYINRGYLPDGLGITYNYERVKPGDKVILDDDLILWFLKRKNQASPQATVGTEEALKA